MSRLALRAARIGDQRVDFAVLGEGPAVVLVHGGRCTADDWAPLVPRLAGRYRLVLPDGFAWPLCPWAVWQVLDYLGIERAVLVGHSWGGMFIRQLYRLAPDRVRALVNIDSAGFGPIRLARHLPLEQASAETRRRYAFLAAEMAQLAPPHRGDYPSRATIDRRLAAYARGEIGLPARQAERRHLPLVELAPRPAPEPIPETGKFIVCPALLIQTGRGRFRLPEMDLEQLQRDLQTTDLTYELISEAGHWPWLEDLDGFLRRLAPFLERHAG